jgi:hypothetical protein
MTTAVVRRPVAVDELRRAWAAVQAGEFRAGGVPDRHRPSRPAPSASRWTPSSGERVLPVIGCTGSCGATTVAVALATAAEGSARVLECGPATATGLAAASTAELGVTDAGWVQGSRGPVLLERAHSPWPGDGVPLPGPVEGPTLTVVDVAHPIEDLLDADGWLPALIADASVVVVVARVTVPSLRRLESCFDLLGAGRVVAVVVGPPRKRWPREVTHNLGPLTRSVMDADRLVQVPEDKALAVAGLTPAPLPASLLTAAAALLLLTKGTSPHAS